MTLALPLSRLLRPTPKGLLRKKAVENLHVEAKAANSAAMTESQPMDAAMPLGVAAKGTVVQVVGFRNNGRGFEKRLEAMGIRVGSELEVIQHEGGSLVVRVGECRVALGVAMKHRILVTTRR